VLPGTQKRNFTHVDDIISGLILVGERGHGDEYGLGAQEGYSVKEVAEMFGAPIEWLPERSGNRMDSKLNTDRSILELGWSPKRKLADYIQEIKLNKHRG
jgi:UDP-glucose 4-epimerase